MGDDIGGSNRRPRNRRPDPSHCIARLGSVSVDGSSKFQNTRDTRCHSYLKRKKGRKKEREKEKQPSGGFSRYLVSSLVWYEGCIGDDIRTWSFLWIRGPNYFPISARQPCNLAPEGSELLDRYQAFLTAQSTEYSNKLTPRPQHLLVLTKFGVFMRITPYYLFCGYIIRKFD